jgi:aminopeptidase N
MPSSLCRRLAPAALSLALGCTPPADIIRAPQPAPAPEPAIPAPPPLPSGRLPDTARPLRYSIALVVDPSKERFVGDVTIDVDIPAPTSAVVLHGKNLALIRAEAIVGGASIPGSDAIRPPAGGKFPDELVLSFPRRLPPGRAQIRVAYTAPFETRTIGLFRVRDGSDSYAFTQLEPADARRVFPCFDEPGNKTPFELKVTVPKGQLAVANGAEIGRADTPDGRSTTFSFAATEPLPTYLFALGVGPLEIREGPREPVPIRLVATRGKTKLGEPVLETAAAALKLLATYLDRPYPYGKLDLLSVPELEAGGMENAGLVTFRDDLVLLDPASASTGARRNMTELVAHELAHQYLGNLVTMRWWDDLWLNEGLATWITPRIVDTLHPGTDALGDATLAKLGVMDLDGLSAIHPVRQPVVATGEAEDAFDPITYDKGAAVMGMLEAWIGPEAMQKGLRAHIAAHANGVATADDLIAALGEASGKDVAHVASAFLDHAGVPLVRAELACERNKPPRVSLKRTRYRARPALPDDRPDLTPWKVPVCVTAEGSATPVCGLLGDDVLDLALPGERCPKYVYPNANEAGYYRFSVPSAQWSALVASVKRLSPRERAGLVADAWALVQSGDLGADALFDLLAALRGERNRVVVAQMVATLEEVRGTLIDAGTEPGFRNFVGSLFAPLGKELGWETRKTDGEEQRLLRAEVLWALGLLAEDTWALGQADRRAAAYLDDPRTLDADTTGIALLAAARRADEKRLVDLRDAIRKAATPEERAMAVRALGGLRNPKLLERALDLALTGDLHAHEVTAALTQASRGAAQAAAMAWLRDRWPELRARMSLASLGELLDLVGGLCEAKARDEAAAFFEKALAEGEGTPRRLKEAVEQSDQCIALRAREALKVKKRLGR